MSVWKKASKANQKIHRERHQPEARKHLGLLEKKKDYVKRLQDYSEKRDTIKLLRKRALNKNPEEFYHHMINAKVSQNGIHHEKDKSEEHTRAQIKIMETQDIRYVNMKRVEEMKRIERLQSQMHLVDVEGKPKNQHKRFFASKNEAEMFTSKRQEDHNAEANRHLDALSEKLLTHFNEEDISKVKLKRENAYKQLAARIKREKELSVVQQKLEVKRYLQTKKKSFPPRKIQGSSKDAPPIYKWKTQRKK